MTADDYFQNLCPTEADFAEWTQSLFARADRINAQLVRKYPNLFKTKSADEFPL